MANLSELEVVALVVGVVIQGIGLVALYFQLRKVNTSIRVTAQSALYQQSSGVRSAIVEYPELRQYFFDGKEIGPDSENYSRTRTIAEMFLNYLEHLILQKESLRQADYEAWNRFVCRTISASPIMQSVLKEKPEYYSADLLISYEKGCEDLNLAAKDGG